MGHLVKGQIDPNEHALSHFSTASKIILIVMILRQMKIQLYSKYSKKARKIVKLPTAGEKSCIIIN